MDLIKKLEKIGVSLDLGCVYSVNYGETKILVAYQGNIEIDKKLVSENGFKV